MKWSALNTIRPKGKSPEFHVIVLDETAPKSAEVKDIIHDRRDITRMSWVTGVVVYNLFEDDRFPNFLEKYGKMAEENIRYRSKVKRGTTRDSNGEGDMVASGECKNRQGEVGSYRNMRNCTDKMKYDIDEKAADVMDVLVEVPVSAYQTDFRL